MRPRADDGGDKAGKDDQQDVANPAGQGHHEADANQGRHHRADGQVEVFDDEVVIGSRKSCHLA